MSQRQRIQRLGVIINERECIVCGTINERECEESRGCASAAIKCSTNSVSTRIVHQSETFQVHLQPVMSRTVSFRLTKRAELRPRGSPARVSRLLSIQGKLGPRFASGEARTWRRGRRRRGRRGGSREDEGEK